MADLLYNEAAVDVLTRANTFRMSMRYENAVLNAVLVRPNLASDVLARLGVKQSIIFGHTQNLISTDGTWLSEKDQASERLFGCEPDKIRSEAITHASMLNNDYIGPEHLLLGAVSSSTYLAEELMSLYDVSIDTLRSKIIEKQSEPPIIIKQEYEGARMLFRTIDLATDVRELEYMSSVLDKCVNKWEDEKQDIYIKLRQWHQIRMNTPESGNEQREVIIREFPWIKY